MILTVLVPTWKRPRSLRRCLAALAEQRREPDQVVLVVRADDEPTRELLAGRETSLPLEIATPEATGVVAALNAGFDACRGDVIAITDDDTEPLPDWLGRIERHFEADPRLGALGGRDRVVGTDDEGEGDPALAVGRVLWFGRVTGNHHIAAGPPREVDIVKGADMAVRRAALGERRLDTRLRGTGAEHHWEIDLSLGLQAAGWRLLYDPAVEVIHHEAERFGGQREQEMTAAERFDAVHNQTLALQHLRGSRRARAIAYALLVGTRADPGPALALETVLRRRSAPGESWARLRTATAARLAALREWRRDR